MKILKIITLAFFLIAFYSFSQSNDLSITGEWDLVQIDINGEYEQTGEIWRFSDDNTCIISDGLIQNANNAYVYQINDQSCNSSSTSQNPNIKYLRIENNDSNESLRCYQIVNIRSYNNRKYLSLYAFGDKQSFVLREK